MSNITAFAASWEDRMLQSCLSEEVEVTTTRKSRNTKKRILHDPLDDGMLKDEVDILTDAVNQTSLTQSSSDCSSSSFEEGDDDNYSSSSEDSDISLCRSRQFGQELDLNRRKDILYSPHHRAEASSKYSESAELTTDSGECVTTSIADFFFGPEGPCNPHLAEDEFENVSKLRVVKSPAAPPAALKKSSLKQVATILEKSSLNRRKRKNVGFHKVNIREYQISISHNPSCSEGPPIELAWEFREATPVPVDMYEECRGPKKRLAELVLRENTRRRMLLESGGYSKQDLKEAIREVEHLKRQRILTYMMLPASALDEAAEEMFGSLFSAFK
jgi:hypothetical protein